MIKKVHNKRGFGLIEIILAVSVFALSVMGLTGGLVYGEQSSVLALHRAQAVLLAEEGLEATRNIADESFSNLADGDFGLAIENNSYIFSGSSDVWDIYERQITVQNVDANTKQITSRVSWSQNVLNTGNIEFTTHITNWE